MIGPAAIILDRTLGLIDTPTMIEELTAHRYRPGEWAQVRNARMSGAITTAEYGTVMARRRWA